MSDKKSIEQRIEELENLVYLNKNVLSLKRLVSSLTCRRVICTS